MFKNLLIRLSLILLMIDLAACSVTGASPITPSPAASISTSTQAVMPSAELQPVAGSYLFAEGPAADAQGNVYFSDINAGKIYKWSPDGQVSVFVDGLKGPNGLAFDKNGLLIVCEGGYGRIISIDSQHKVTVLADLYQGVRFNEPNDLWIDPQGGMYFTDPAFNSPVIQGGEDVYYLSPDKSQVMRVIADLVRPNGIVGTKDGKTLFVTDYGAGKTFAYNINSDGTLSDESLFVSTGSDGIDLDAQGDLYLTTTNTIQVFDAAGNHLRDLSIPENPTNLTFAGKDGKTLFITARTAVYTFQIAFAGSDTETASTNITNPGGFLLTSPDVKEGGLLPAEYTCDGAANTLTLSWSGVPAGTKSFAVIMHHVASKTDIHWYWVIYDIPADVTSLAKNITGIGTLGTNSVNDKQAYTPPCSKGPGPKTYTYTIYALSEQPQFSIPTNKVTRAVLLNAIRDIILASAELHVVYNRK